MATPPRDADPDLRGAKQDGGAQERRPGARWGPARAPTRGPSRGRGSGSPRRLFGFMSGATCRSGDSLRRDGRSRSCKGLEPERRVEDGRGGQYEAGHEDRRAEEPRAVLAPRDPDSGEEAQQVGDAAQHFDPESPSRSSEITDAQRGGRSHRAARALGTRRRRCTERPSAATRWASGGIGAP